MWTLQLTANPGKLVAQEETHCKIDLYKHCIGACIKNFIRGYTIFLETNVRRKCTNSNHEKIHTQTAG